MHCLCRMCIVMLVCCSFMFPTTLATVVNPAFSTDTMTKQPPFRHGITCAIIALLLSFLSKVTDFPSKNEYLNGGYVGVQRHTSTRNWSLQQITLDSFLPLWSRATDWLTIYTVSNTRNNVDLSSNGLSVPTPSPIPLHVPSPRSTQPQSIFSQK